MTSVNLGKPPNILRSKKAYGLKILLKKYLSIIVLHYSLGSENIIKKYRSIIVLHYYIVIFLYVFLYPERDYTSTK